MQGEWHGRRPRPAEVRIQTDDGLARTGFLAPHFSRIFHRDAPASGFRQHMAVTVKFGIERLE